MVSFPNWAVHGLGTMPLVILCGLPSSGKTRRAGEVAELFQKQDKEVHVVSDDFSLVGKNQLYASSREEKTARANLKSQVGMDHKYRLGHCR